MLDSERDSSFAASRSPDESSLLRKTLLDTVSDLVATDTSVVPREVAKAATGDGGLSEALLSCMRVAYLSRDVAHRIRLRDPTHAEAMVLLSTQLQLCSAALVQLLCATDEDVENHLGEGQPGRYALSQALVMEAKVFLSQGVIRNYTKLTWQGHLARTHRNLSKRVYSSVSGVLLSLLLVAQLPLLLVFAVWPPLDKNLKRWSHSSSALRQAYLLSTPVVKFGISVIFDLVFASIMTFSSRERFTDDWKYFTMVVWAGSLVMWELGQAFQLQDTNSLVDILSVDPIVAALLRFEKFYSERFNRVDLPGAALALATLLCIRLDIDDNGVEAQFRPLTRALRSFSVLLLWLRAPRVFLLSENKGPVRQRKRTRGLVPCRRALSKHIRTKQPFSDCNMWFSPSTARADDVQDDQRRDRLPRLTHLYAARLLGGVPGTVRASSTWRRLAMEPGGQRCQCGLHGALYRLYAARTRTAAVELTPC